MAAPRRSKSLLPWHLVALFLLLAAGIGAIGYGYVRSELKHATQEKQNELAAIADLKAGQIKDWRMERMDEAKSILSTSFMPQAAGQWLEGGQSDDKLRQSLLAWMAAPRYMRHYSHILLLDTQGKVRLAFPHDNAPPDALSTDCAQHSLHKKAVILRDFHFSDNGNYPHLDLCVPLFDVRPGHPPTGIGALLLEIDPQRFLYPLIQSWPTPSPTAETQLVRRDGDSVQFLNELRHRKNTALSLRLPMSDTALSSVQAVLGEEGFIFGKDYRGVEVLSVQRKIPGSPWFLIAKVDRAEVEAPLRQRVIMVTAAGALLIGLAAIAALLLWRQQLLRLDLARHEFEEDTLLRTNTELEARVAERTRALQEEIAQHQLTEKALKESMEDLSRSNADLKQFAYIASHDLQEPLRMVASFVQLLARRYRDQLDQDARDFIGYAVEGVTRMQRLINDQLTYALVGIEEGRFEMADCNQILTEVLANLRPLIEEHHAEISSDALPRISLIYSQFSQLLQNLIGNAIKFHGEKTPQIHVGARLDGNDWVFSVSDNGIGIAPEYFDKIFLIFKRLHSREKYPGTGIGLAICKRIVERHHGRIWVESELGNGTTVYFTLPTTLEGQQPIP